MLLKPGFGLNRPLPLGRSTLCAFSLAPSSALKPSNDTPRPEKLNRVMTYEVGDIVSYELGLALVLPELEKSDAPLP